MWTSLRNGLKKGESSSAAKAAKSGASSALAMLRRLKPEQFAQRDFAAFVRTVQDAGIALLPIDEFAARYKAYYEANPKPAAAADALFGHFKFDIHGDIKRPVEMARLLHGRGVPGLFLIMHRHALNEFYYDTPLMWDALTEIRELGHEIGLHVDPFHLITKYGTLYDGLEAALGEFKAHGFPMRALTLHGDSRPHIKATKLQANDFFVDDFRQSKWNGVPPEGDEGLAEHVRKYKHRRLFRHFGIEYVADVNFVHRGKLINHGAMMYLSDNQRRLRIGSIASEVERSGVLAAPELFSIPAAFADEAARVLRRRPFLALFHPQWFR